MNILITSASRKVWLIREFRKALDNCGYTTSRVIPIDASLLSATLWDDGRCPDGQKSPHGLGDIFVRYLREACLYNKIKLIVPTRDDEIPFFAKNFGLGLGNARIMCPDEGTAILCRDKQEFYSFCSDYKFDHPRVIFASPDVVPFPVFVKDAFGRGSVGAGRVDNAHDLEIAVSHLRYPIIQEYIDWDEYTVDLFADFAGKIISVVPRQRISTFGGESFVGRTVKDWKIINESIRLATALALIGHNTIQCFYNGTDVKFIEVNPRFGGGAALGFAAGHSTPEYLVRLLAGEVLEPRIGQFEDNLYMLRYTEDVFVRGEDMELAT